MLLTGTLALSGDDYANADIHGVLDRQALTFTAAFSGSAGTSSKGVEWLWFGTITGAVSSDYNTLSGTLVDDEGTSMDFNLNR